MFINQAAKKLNKMETNYIKLPNSGIQVASEYEGDVDSDMHLHLCHIITSGHHRTQWMCLWMYMGIISLFTNTD